ncbi:hypothetical protein [Novipirellula galeiformis]|uniref:hypothetical protein n=1 Tax=Novipirellula galeiformis TaxID=2528004 RepID=UPI0011B4D307|nr:hypothetical protein [Novipirellula galeiformis]
MKIDSSCVNASRQRTAPARISVLVLCVLLCTLVIADRWMAYRQSSVSLPPANAPHRQANQNASSSPESSEFSRAAPTKENGVDSTALSQTEEAGDVIQLVLAENTPPSKDSLTSENMIEREPKRAGTAKTSANASFVFNRTAVESSHDGFATNATIPAKLARHPSMDNRVTPVSNSQPSSLPLLPSQRVKSASTLPYTTSMESQLKCRELLDQASHEFRVKAWLSAETSTWAALTQAVEGIQIAKREASHELGDDRDPLLDLQQARAALMEVRDFAEQSTSASQIEMSTIVRSHRTKTLNDVDLEGMSSTKAIEAYLDEARRTFAKLAGASVQAAEAMDLLAAIYLSRNDPSTLPSSTSLCLRRAALEGQPQNATLATNLGTQLARVGMLVEARRVLEHSLAIQNDHPTQATLWKVLQQLGQNEQAAKIQAELQLANYPTTGYPTRIRLPEVIQLSPAEFAAVSNSVMPANTGPPQTGNRVPATVASARLDRTSNQAAESTRPNTIYTDMSSNRQPIPPSAADNQGEVEVQPSMMRRTWNSVRNLW